MNEADFTRWFCENYPPDTVIFDPMWHAKSIYHRANGPTNTQWPPLPERTVQLLSEGKAHVRINGDQRVVIFHDQLNAVTV